MRVPDNITPKKRSLEQILNCQKLVRRGKFTERGNISDTFRPSQCIDHTTTITYSSVRYKKWVLAQHLNRYQSQSDHKNKLSAIPSFAPRNSLLSIDWKPVTRIVFTPIIPYLVFSTIYTTMVNFQDVLPQKKIKDGPLWSDGLQRRFSCSNLKIWQYIPWHNRIPFRENSYHLLWKVSGRKWNWECSYRNRNVRNFSSQFCYEWIELCPWKERNDINCWNFRAFATVRIYWK